uniref:Putative licpodalin-4 1 n=1 Tax=Amblyomma triste TaxID=251400 RepID=A0A023GB12_AMBTT
MFILELSFVITFCADKTMSASSKTEPYEEDELHFNEQKILEVMSIHGKIFVKERNYHTNTYFRCHNIRIEEKLDNTTFTLLLGAAPSVNKTTSYILYINSTVKLLKTGRHLQYNAGNFTYFHGGLFQVRKLLHIGSNKTCIIMLENRNLSSGLAECQLLMPAKAIDGSIPPKCDIIYRENCPGESVELYNEYCKKLAYLSSPKALDIYYGSEDAKEKGLLALVSA